MHKCCDFPHTLQVDWILFVLVSLPNFPHTLGCLLEVAEFYLFILHDGFGEQRSATGRRDGTVATVRTLMATGINYRFLIPYVQKDNK